MHPQRPAVLQFHQGGELGRAVFRRAQLFGVVYVGNDKLKNLFTERELTLMTSFCSTAALLIELAAQLDELKLDKAKLIERLEGRPTATSSAPATRCGTSSGRSTRSPPPTSR